MVATKVAPIEELGTGDTPFTDTKDGQYRAVLGETVVTAAPGGAVQVSVPAGTPVTVLTRPTAPSTARLEGGTGSGKTHAMLALFAQAGPLPGVEGSEHERIRQAVSTVLDSVAFLASAPRVQPDHTVEEAGVPAFPGQVLATGLEERLRRLLTDPTTVDAVTEHLERAAS
ncbi:hypothetical protein GXW82_43990 [Streptacidiphilus sp. 4-A2]|nr:hypothetical protein [Streptacidiphilus sp. 4-A2]